MIRFLVPCMGFQDCFADLKEPNCEGYLKRPANNSRQLRLYGMLKRLPEKHIPEFSDPYEHKLCAFHRQPMHLSDTAFKYRSPPYLDISVHEPVPVQASSHTLRNTDGLLQSKCHRPQYTGPASKSGQDNILINLMGQLSCLDIPVQMGLNA